MIINHPDIEFEYVKDQYNFQEVLDELEELFCNSNEDFYVALDTESYPLSQYGDKASALDPHTSKVRLISLYWDRPIVIDCRWVDPVPLLEFLRDHHIECIAHNAMHDMKAIRGTFGINLSMRCTLVALSTLAVSTGWKAALFRGKGLKDMARDFFSIHLRKDLGTSDWSNDFLTEDQLAYSAMDVAAPKGSDVGSIVIEAYKQVKKVCEEDLQQDFVFELDQDMVPILADMSYEGLPMNRELIKLSAAIIDPLITEAMMLLCKSLNISVEQRLKIVGGEFQTRVVIPPHSAKLLNNNKALVKRVAEATRNSGIEITDLQADTLLSFIKELEREEDNGEEEEEENNLRPNLREDITLVKILLDYKKYSKMRSELDKYNSNLNPVTGNLHTGTSVIGTSTGRMSSSGFGSARINIQQIGTIPFSIEYGSSDILFDQNSSNQ